MAYRSAMAQAAAGAVRAAAEARKARLLKDAVTDAKRLATADRLYEEGDVRVAAMIYVRLALSRPRNATTFAARQRLAKVAQEAREKLEAIDASLAGETDVSSQPGVYPPNELAGPAAEQGEDPITAAFREYDQLAEQYGEVPAVKREIARHIAKQRRRPEYASVLNEPDAKELWEVGQAHEGDGQQCCAYWVYEEAARLAPAPSAKLAQDRLAEIKQDPRIVASAKTCRELQWCHKTYNRAEKLIKPKPDRAKELFAQIVGRAPEDSEVYRAALAYTQGTR